MAPAISSPMVFGPPSARTVRSEVFLAASVIGREVPERIVGEVLDGGRVHHQGGVHRGQEGVAVRGGARDLLGADHRVGAGPVLDHDRLSPVLAHALRDHAREDVGRAAGRKRHDDADRPAGKRLGGRRGLLRGRCRRQPRGGRSEAPRAAWRNGRFIGNLPPCRLRFRDTRHCGAAGNRFCGSSGRAGRGRTAHPGAISINRGIALRCRAPPAINYRK